MNKFIEIPDGWEIDIEKLKSTILKPIKKNKKIDSFTVGSRFGLRDSDVSEEYMLICTEDIFCLINTTNGSNWSNSIPRENHRGEITENQLTLLNDGDPWEQDFIAL